METSKLKGVSRTKTGLVLLIAGLILGAIPYVMYLGATFAIVGAIVVIIGQRSFHPRRPNLVIGAVIIYIVGYGTIVLAASVFGLSIGGAGGGQVWNQTLIDDFNGFLVAGLIGNVVIAVAYVLFTYALQDKAGRLLLYASFGLQLAFGALAAYIISGQVVSAVSQSSRTVRFDPTPITSLQAQLQYLQLLGLIPAGLFALAYRRAYSRTGEMFPRQ